MQDRPLTEEERRHIDELLRGWLERCRVSLSAYNDATTRTTAAARRLGVPAVILSALVATAVFATLKQDPALEWRILTGIIALGAAVLSALQTFLRQPERADQFREAARSYGRLRRRIERAMLLPPTTKHEADAVLDDLTAALAEAGQGKPNVPQGVWDRAEYRVKGRSDATGVRAVRLRLRRRFDFGVGDQDAVALVEAHGRYFSGLQEAKIVPLACVRTTVDVAAHAPSVRVARDRMREAAAGRRSRRAPLDVREIEDGRYELIDGNATFLVAIEDGWGTVPVRVLGDY